MFVRFLIGSFMLLGLVFTVGFAQAQQEEKKGTVIGVVAEKGANWIDVKADGEEKARRYTRHFGNPGGTDKATLELMSKIAIGTRVKLEWLFHERPRVMKLEVLKKDEKK
jgi:hypothetical protein